MMYPPTQPHCNHDISVETSTTQTSQLLQHGAALVKMPTKRRRVFLITTAAPDLPSVFREKRKKNRDHYIGLLLQGKGDEDLNQICCLLFPLHLLLLSAYSWIGRPVQTHTQIICRETERATTYLNKQMKSS